MLSQLERITRTGTFFIIKIKSERTELIDYSNEAVANRLSSSPSLMNMLRASVARQPEKPALVYYRNVADLDPVIVTYAELLAQTESAAAGFNALGIRPDDGIAILLPAIPESVATFIAASAVGVAFPINLLLSAQSIVTQLELSKAKAAVVLGERSGKDIFDRFSEAAAQYAHLEKIIQVGLSPNTNGGWREFLASSDCVPSDHKDRDRIAAVFHTGGTTGNPKLAQLSEFNLAAGAFMSAGAIKWQEADRVMVCMPMFHVGGNLTCTMSTLAAGGTVIFPGPLGARDTALIGNIWSMLEKSDTTVLVMVPTSLSSIYDIPIGMEKLDNFRGIATGSTALSPDLGAAIQTKIGRPVSQIYGMTETSGICAAQACDGNFREHAVGVPAPLLEWKINLKTDEHADRGDIFVRGPNSFHGYRTSNGIVDDPEGGWIDTGDLGQVGSDGQLRLVGRAKDTIIRSGHNIDPLLVEEAIQSHPSVRQAAATSMPDAYAGEIPVLYVSLRTGHSVTTSEFESYIASRIGEPPARPKHIFIVDELPLTAVGKIARFKLRQQAAIWRSMKTLSDLPIAEVSCIDPAGKQMSIVWNSSIDNKNMTEAGRRLTEIGLNLVNSN